MMKTTGTVMVFAFTALTCLDKLWSNFYHYYYQYLGTKLQAFRRASSTIGRA